MKKKSNKLLVIIIALMIVTLTFHENSIAQIVSQYVYGDALTEQGFSLYETHDSVLIFAGYTDSLDTAGQPEENVYIGKINNTGSHIWTNGYRIDTDERGYCIIENLNDTTYEYITVGDVLIGGDSKLQFDAFIMRTDTSGALININRFGGGNDEHARSVIPVDTGYAVVGYTEQSSTVPNDVYLVYTDRFGNLTWATGIDIDNRDDYGFDIILKDDLLYITGNTVDTTTRLSQAFLMCTNLSGTVQWVQLYGDTAANDYSYSLKQTPENDGFVMIGHSYGYNAGADSHVLIITTDASGNPVWQGLYDFGNPDSSDFGRDILVVPDSGYFGIGYSYVDNSFTVNKTIFRIDFNGNLIWVKSFGNDEDDFGYSGVLLGSTVAAIGTTLSLGTNIPDAYFVRTTRNDSLDCVDFVPDWTESIIQDDATQPDFGNEEHTAWNHDTALVYPINIWSLICTDTVQGRNGNFVNVLKTCDGSLTLYPNPTSGTININFHKINGFLEQLEIFDMSGKLVSTLPIEENQVINNLSLEFNLPPGFYLIRAKTDTGVFNTTLAVQY